MAKKADNPGFELLTCCSSIAGLWVTFSFPLRFQLVQSSVSTAEIEDMNGFKTLISVTFAFSKIKEQKTEAQRSLYLARCSRRSSVHAAVRFHFATQAKLQPGS